MGTLDFKKIFKMRFHARLSFIATTNLTSFVTLIRCLIGRSKPLVRFEEFGQAVFHKEVQIQRSTGTPSKTQQARDLARTAQSISFTDLEACDRSYYPALLQ